MKASETYECRAPSAIMAGVKHAKWSIFSAFLKPVQSDNLQRSSQVKKGRVVKITLVVQKQQPQPCGMPQMHAQRLQRRLPQYFSWLMTVVFPTGIYQRPVRTGRTYMSKLEPLTRFSSLASMPSMDRAYISRGMSSLRPP